MDSKKLKTSAEPQPADKQKTRSIDSFREGDVWCNIYPFVNKTGKYHRFTMARSYRDKVGDWKRTQFFGIEDSDDLVRAAATAADRIRALREL